MGDLVNMGLLLMSDKERLRKATLEMVKQGKITLIMTTMQCLNSNIMSHILIINLFNYKLRN